MKIKILIVSLFLSSCVKPESHDEHSIILNSNDEIPEICKPWKPDPKSSEPAVLLTSEELEEKSIDSFHNPKALECFNNDNLCNFKAILNENRFSKNNYWPIHHDELNGWYTAPSGYESDCEDPLDDEEVICTIKVTNSEMDQIAEAVIVCPGLINPGECHEISFKEKIVAYEVASPGEISEMEKARIARLKERYETCSEFCRHGSPTSHMCADYWNSYLSEIYRNSYWEEMPDTKSL